MDERLVNLYNTELRHLREMAGEFAREYPKIAGRLALDRDAKELCPDPYVERLLEGFAWLASRVHLKLDAEFPRFTQALLETVYPHYLSPVPSMAVVRFEIDPQQPALAPRAAIRLRLQTTGGQTFDKINLSSLTFYTRGAEELAGSIYEQIFARRLGL